MNIIVQPLHFAFKNPFFITFITDVKTFSLKKTKTNTKQQKKELKIYNEIFTRLS